MMFHILTLLEYPEPDWNDGPFENVENRITEICFDVDEHIRNEVKRVTEFVKETVSLVIEDRNLAINALWSRDFFKFILQGNRINVSTTSFCGYGKNFMKTHRLHPDAYIQMIIQVVYYKMHLE